MMEIIAGLPRDVVSLVWHEVSSRDDHRADRTPTERGKHAGKRDIRVLAKLKSPNLPEPRMASLDELTRGAGAWRNVGRIAVVTDELLYRHAIQFLGPFFHGPIRVFTNAQSVEARMWLDGRPLH